MKKIIFAIAIFCLPLSSLADTVKLKFIVDFQSPSRSGAIVEESSFAFVGTNKIVFKVLDKTCTFVGSMQAIGPVGCNYWMTVNLSTMSLYNPGAQGNPGCTEPKNMLASCK